MNQQVDTDMFDPAQWIGAETIRNGRNHSTHISSGPRVAVLSDARRVREYLVGIFQHVKIRHSSTEGIHLCTPTEYPAARSNTLFG